MSLFCFYKHTHSHIYTQTYSQQGSRIPADSIEAEIWRTFPISFLVRTVPYFPSYFPSTQRELLSTVSSSISALLVSTADISISMLPPALRAQGREARTSGCSPMPLSEKKKKRPKCISSLLPDLRKPQGTVKRHPQKCPAQPAAGCALASLGAPQAYQLLAAPREKQSSFSGGQSRAHTDNGLFWDYLGLSPLV